MEPRALTANFEVPLKMRYNRGRLEERFVYPLVWSTVSGLVIAANIDQMTVKVRSVCTAYWDTISLIFGHPRLHILDRS